MSTALLVMTDGRSYVDDAIRSAVENLLPSNELTELWIHDDSGDEGHRIDLAALYEEWGFRLIPSGPRRGFGGAIRNAWTHLRKHSEADYVLHLEDDFIFNRPVDLREMQQILDVRPNLAQVALRRQPWNDNERLAGGIIEQHPDSYVRHSFMDLCWLEHANFFTTNPCMYRRNMLSLVWPEGAESEGHFGMMLKSSGMNFAYLGERSSPPWVHHIGDERVGTGY